MEINHVELIAQRAEPIPMKTQPPPEQPKERTAEEQVPERYHEYLDIFAKPIAGQLPPHRKWDLKVRLLPNAPTLISCVPYQLSRAEQEFQSQYIKENLARGFIQKLSSPYSTPVFYNWKKDGGFRPLFDYQKINAITIKDVSPLPRINTILEDTIGAVLFSKFDLREGYCNVAVEEESQDILAFNVTIRPRCRVVSKSGSVFSRRSGWYRWGLYRLKRLSRSITWYVRWFRSHAKSRDRIGGFRSCDRSGDLVTWSKSE